MSAPVPEIVPENVVLVLSLPVASVAEPSATEPAPASEPTVWLKFARLRVAPLATVTALLGAKVFAAPACNVPALTVVAPLYVLLAVKIVVPVPFCWNAPVPETSPPKVKTSDRLTAKMPLLATLPTIEPLVPPSPSCKVPAEIVVPPVYELSPLRIIVPVQSWSASSCRVRQRSHH
jgi:hypothetical protein